MTLFISFVRFCEIYGHKTTMEPAFRIHTESAMKRNCRQSGGTVAHIEDSHDYESGFGRYSVDILFRYILRYLSVNW